MNVRMLAAGFVCFGLILVLARAEDRVDHARVGLPAGLVGADMKPAAASVVAFLEGPAIDDRGNVYYSDIAGNRILKSDSTGKVTVFRADSGRTNGNTFDAKGRLISCEGADSPILGEGSCFFGPTRMTRSCIHETCCPRGSSWNTGG